MEVSKGFQRRCLTTFWEVSGGFMAFQVVFEGICFQGCLEIDQTFQEIFEGVLRVL